MSGKYFRRGVSLKLPIKCESSLFDKSSLAIVDPFSHLSDAFIVALEMAALFGGGASAPRWQCSKLISVSQRGNFAMFPLLLKKTNLLEYKASVLIPVLFQI